MPPDWNKHCEVCGSGFWGQNQAVCPACYYKTLKDSIPNIMPGSLPNRSVAINCSACLRWHKEGEPGTPDCIKCKARNRALELNSGIQERLDFGGTDRIELKPDGSEFWGAGIEYKITYGVYKVAELKPKPLLFPKASWAETPGDYIHPFATKDINDYTEVSTVDKTGKPGYIEYKLPDDLVTYKDLPESSVKYSLEYNVEPEKPGTNTIAGKHYDTVKYDDLDPEGTEKKAASDASLFWKFYTKYNAEKSGNYADPSLIKADKDIDDPPPVKTPFKTIPAAEAVI